MTPEENIESNRHKLSVVIPCFNEETTLESCVNRVLALSSEDLDLEIVIVNDCSVDLSLAIARKLEARHPQIVVLHHEQNQGKGAALRTGFRNVTGDFVAVQDADLEYDPRELRDLVRPLKAGNADVVIGSRFKGGGPRRVLYFWHSVGNAILTLISNMFTDLNLTDMETCYKVFKKEVIQGIEIEENRFGFEPEIIAKIAHSDLRIYEMAISYSGRTYEEGKKITWKDGVRALYCIFRYNANHLPLPIKFMAYLSIGAAAALVNLLCFLFLIGVEIPLKPAAAVAFIVAAGVSYFLCIALLFRHKAPWRSLTEVVLYLLVVAAAGLLDLGATSALYTAGLSAALSKALSSLLGVIVAFVGRQFVVFSNG